MKRLFIDMDGTVARFYESKHCIEEMTEKGFFKNLKPYKKVLAGLKKFSKKHPEIEFCVISAVPFSSPFAEEEKDEWLNEHFPVQKRVFLQVGKNKADFVPDISKDDFLLDDYTKNLTDWEASGGTGIKVRNELNCQKGTWKGNKVSSFDSSDGILEDLEAIMLGI